MALLSHCPAYMDTGFMSVKLNCVLPDLHAGPHQQKIMTAGYADWYTVYWTEPDIEDKVRCSATVKKESGGEWTVFHACSKDPGHTGSHTSKFNESWNDSRFDDAQWKHTKELLPEPPSKPSKLHG